MSAYHECSQPSYVYYADGESEASGSESSKSGGYVAMQTSIAVSRWNNIVNVHKLQANLLEARTQRNE